jgi:hypothetical protein
LLQKIKDELANRVTPNGPTAESIHDSTSSEVPTIEETKIIEEKNILEEIHSKMDSKFKLLKLDETGRSSLLFLNAGGQKKFCIGNDYEI